MKLVYAMKDKIYPCHVVTEVIDPKICAMNGWTQTAHPGATEQDQMVFAVLDSIQVDIGWRVYADKMLPPGVPALEDVKIDKLKEIATARLETEEGGVRFAGLLVHTDDKSQAKLTSAFVTYQAIGAISPDWKCADGWLPITGINDLMAMAMAVQAHVQNCFIAEKALAAQVEAATTIEQVRALSWKA